MNSKKIHEVLRNQIIHLEMEPEHIINVSDLAASFGISRTPIKEALILLQGEGWILRHASHFMVTPLSFKRLKDNVEIRLMMEPQAYVWAMERMTDAHKKELLALKQQMEEISPDEPAKTYGQLDQKFHETLLRATNNQELYAILSRVIGQCLRYWLSPIERDKPNYFNSALEIIDAVLKKDTDKLKETTAQHIKMSLIEVQLM